jgi:hypothetical protein
MEKAPLYGTIPDFGVFEKSTKEADVSDASVHAPSAIATARILNVSATKKLKTSNQSNMETEPTIMVEIEAVVVKRKVMQDRV